MKKLVGVATVLAALALVSAPLPAQETRKITIATEGAFPPWNGTGANGALFGAEIDLIEVLCPRMGVTCEVVTQDFEGMIPALTAGKFDAIIAAMSITDERRKRIGFSKPYFFSPARIVVLAGSPLERIDTVDKLNLNQVGRDEAQTLALLGQAMTGMTVGAQIATINAVFIERFLGNAVTLRTYQTQNDMSLDLVAGRIDAAVAENTVWAAFQQTELGKNIRLIGPAIAGGGGIGVGLRQADESLRAQFNDAIDSLKADGALREISLKWFGTDNTP